MVRGVVIALVLCFHAPLALSQEDKPTPEEVATFARYHVAEMFSGRRAQPDMRDHDARMFRTRLRWAAKHGANFAGYYALAIWGCGGGCVEFAVINLRDGHVTFFPASVSWVDEKDSGVRFQKSSRALHAVGALNEKDSADRWYEWTGSTFKLISQKPAELERTHSE